METAEETIFFEEQPAVAHEVPSFAEVYEDTVAFVGNVLRRLGIGNGEIDDVTQDVFAAVHRRLDGFEGRCSVKTWVLGILLGIVRNHRRRLRRKGKGESLSASVVDPSSLVDSSPDPSELASRREAGQLLRKLLEGLQDEHVTVFVLAEVDGLSAPQIAAQTRVNINTVYSRLRTARQQFKRGLDRLHAETDASDAAQRSAPVQSKRRRRRCTARATEA